MPKAQQLTVSCENRPGTLAQIAKVLGDAKVTILAFVNHHLGSGGLRPPCRRQREQGKRGPGRRSAFVLRGGRAAY